MNFSPGEKFIATVSGLAADIQTVFSRSWTSLFVQSRDNRQVIDRERVGHRGTPIGKVDAIVRSRSGDGRLRFRINREIEVHDGLQIDVPGLPRPYGFAVDWFRIASLSKSVRTAGPAGVGRDASDFRYRAPAGSVMEVALPSDHPDIPRGAVIYCASSQAIKRRYRFARPSELWSAPAGRNGKSPACRAGRGCGICRRRKSAQ